MFVYAVWNAACNVVARGVTARGTSQMTNCTSELPARTTLCSFRARQSTSKDSASVRDQQTLRELPGN
jgi:hypothetical protein